MGLFSKIRGEFVDIIDWTDDSNDTMVWRFPRYQNEIKMGAKLTVRESQVAIFVNEGAIADEFVPGMYELQTQNMPILTTLKGWKYGFDSPFKAEVYFVNTKQFTNQKWGTKNPIMLRDPEFGPIRVRAFGNFAMRVKDAKKLLKEITGTNAHFTTDEIADQLRNLVITRFSDAIAESKIPVLDLASKYDELSDFISGKINPEFEELGIEITKFLIENISLPPEVETALDKRSSMGIIGNLGAYTQFQAANAMEKAAENGDSGMGAGVGMGMGFGMANQMGNMFTQQSVQNGGAAGTPPPIPTAISYFVAINGAQAGPYSEQELRQMVAQGTFTRDSLVWKNGMPAWIAASQVTELSGLFADTPPPLPPM
jgi:membrane protease subunit (stomatin/prohibitin family)